MRRRVRAVRIVVVAGLALAGLAFAAAPAQAIFHFMKIREVHEGGASADYVELQMYAGGQNFVSGHYLVAYDGGGTQFGPTYQFPSNAGNGENQRTILVADSNPIGVTPDFVISTTNFLVGTGGSVCFIDTLPSNGIDCATWGPTTMPPMTNPSPVGTPAPPMSPGESLERTIAPNCATLLEDADDTNDSATDFALAPPSPRNNATPPTETACGPGGGGAGGGGPDTKIDKKPKDKTKKRKVTYRFSSSTAGATFECSENGKPFHACTSPHTFKAKKGKNEFEVRAVDPAGNVDQSPADDSFKRKKKR
jgi:hypothetical protein